MSDSLLADSTLRDRPRADLLCPHLTCQTPLSWAPDQHQLVCPCCGWVHQLTPDQRADILDALAGITELNLPAYLLILAVAARRASGACDPR